MVRPSVKSVASFSHKLGRMPHSTTTRLFRWPPVLAALAVAIVNGLPFSPYFDPALFWLGKLVGRTWLASPAVFHGSSVVVTVGTLLVAAIPALLARYGAGRWLGPTAQAAIWLASTIAIAWPTLRIAAGFEE